jgi:hypothetical protein
MRAGFVREASDHLFQFLDPWRWVHVAFRLHPKR